MCLEYLLPTNQCWHNVCTGQVPFHFTQVKQNVSAVPYMYSKPNELLNKLNIKLIRAEVRQGCNWLIN
jgi:hypothetical protein